ncbi:MAG TPA: TIGR02677 family protein [Gammaproteobacteria bacterium]|nr:TIGR02677 family protein [Gammaproteobacteria bacterium]
MSSTAFNYVTAEKASLYRTVMQAFAAAKAHFIVHLRPEEIIERLSAKNDCSPDEIPAALEQLVAWGNLLAQPDTGRVTTVEDFYRARHLYQLSRQGEAAEAALAVFDELLGRRGALQAVALRDIRDTLVAIEQLCHETDPDAGRVHALLRDLSRVFEDLADNAQAFMAGLGRALDLRSIERDAFLAYKEKVIDYLKRFVGDLAVLSPDIAQLIRKLDGPVEKLLILVATREAEDLAPDMALDATVDASTANGPSRTPQLEQMLQHWRGHWQGLQAWFIGNQSHPSQASVLQSSARHAILRLLEAVVRLNEKRLGRSDRSADFRTLAGWFMQCDDDGDAHRLWRAAFGLTAARHLSIDEETLAAREQNPVSTQRSWWDAPPLTINPRLRATGSYARRGATAQIRDRRKEKAQLADQIARESEEARQARRHLATGETTTLSAIGELDEGSFRYFLQLLGEALATAENTEAAIYTTTGDGAIEIEMKPLAVDQRAKIHTPFGSFSGRDYQIRITDLEAHT